MTAVVEAPKVVREKLVEPQKMKPAHLRAADYFSHEAKGKHEEARLARLQAEDYSRIGFPDGVKDQSDKADMASLLEIGYQAAAAWLRERYPTEPITPGIFKAK